jgi:Family of unknown function (DUF5690)
MSLAHGSSPASHRTPASATRAVATSDSADGRWGLSVWCVVAAFGTYFCMYGFRKPFTVPSYDDLSYWGASYKTLLVSAQVLGYMLAKFLGIKFVSEASPRIRAAGILALIMAAELALLAFAVIPRPWNLVFLFWNGVPLGMVYGLVLGFLEGRRQTEALVAGLCASFILADGAVKTVGAYVLDAGCPVAWMPVASGALFLTPLFVFVWMLSQIPAPTTADREARSDRAPMSRADRSTFFWRYAPGLTALIVAFLLITVLRSLRADFATEIWSGLGVDGKPSVFTWSELLVAIGVLVSSGLFAALRDNRAAFRWSLNLSAGSLLLLALTLVAHQSVGLPPLVFMVLVGLGLYVPYVAVHTTILERLIALTRDRANLGFLMYLADAWGYLGYVAVMFARGFVQPGESFLDFFLVVSWGVALGGFAALVFCRLYFESARQAPAQAEALASS